MADRFWHEINKQLEELKSAQSADDVFRILSDERTPYRNGADLRCAEAEGFFAGSGEEDSVRQALRAAGWKMAGCAAWYHYAMKAPDGSEITYIEGDIYRGNRIRPQN